MGIKNITNTSISVILTSLTSLIGGWDMVLKILITFIAIDYLTGVLKSIKQKKLSSEIGSNGLIKKGSIFLVVILSNQLDLLLPDRTPLFRTAVCYFYIANEGLSITENIALLGVPLPKFITEFLEKMRDTSDKGGKV